MSRCPLCGHPASAERVRVSLRLLRLLECRRAPRIHLPPRSLSERRTEAA